jgi:hypothetical protein
MNQAGEVILSGATLPGDEKRGGGDGDFPGELEKTERSGIDGNPRQSLYGHC